MPCNTKFHTYLCLENFHFLVQQTMMSQTKLAVLIYMTHRAIILKYIPPCHSKPLVLCASSNE